MSVRVFVDEPDLLLRELLVCSVRTPEFELIWRHGSTEGAPSSPADSDVALWDGDVSDCASMAGLRHFRRQHEHLPILAYVSPPNERELCGLLLAGLQGYVPRFANRAKLHQSIRIAATRQSIWAPRDVRCALQFVSNLTEVRLLELCAHAVGDCLADRTLVRRSALFSVREGARHAVSHEERSAVERLGRALDNVLRAQCST